MIYISGFGDRYDTVRRRLLARWRYEGVTVELLPMKWGSDESFDKKLSRINQAIDRVRGRRIVLIGESASGSMAIHVYAKRLEDIAKVVTLCGKNNHPENVQPRYFAKYPAFKACMARLNDSMRNLNESARRRIVSMHPLYDPVVTVADTRVSGCREVTLWSVGHLFVILQLLTIWSHKVIEEIDRDENPKA